jgi:hypothetical protein
LLASPCRIRPGFLPATGGFYFQAFDGSVTLPAAGYDYDIERATYPKGDGDATEIAAEVCAIAVARGARMLN